MGGDAIHIPFHTTWEQEEISKSESENHAYKTLKTMKELIDFLDKEYGLSFDKK